MEVIHPLQTITLSATADTTEGLFIAPDGSICGTGEKSVGVSRDAAASGKALPVVTVGIYRVIAGGTITANSPVTSNSEGKAIACSDLAVTVPAGATGVTSDAAQPTLSITGSATPEAINGYAMKAAGAGDYVYIKLV